MRQVQPQVGDVIAVEYRGMRQPAGGGNPYHDYKVARDGDGPAQEFDWGKGAPPPEPEPVGPAEPVVYAQDDPGPDETKPVPQEDEIPF
jgi:hypothetical protein